MGRWLALPAALLLCVAGAGVARADCSGGAEYNVTVTGNTVQVLPELTARKCGGPIGMLRQNVDTGEVVELANDCDEGRYVDECVPPGDYRYGFATAYDCSEQGCGGVQYYVAVIAPTPVSPCVRSGTSTEATAYSAPVPWASSSSSLRECPSGCGCSAPGRGALGFDGAVVALSLVALWRRRRATAVAPSTR